MEIIRKHLSDQQWGDLLAPHDASDEHLAECARCRLEVEKVRGFVNVLPEWSRSAGDHPDIFWERQRLAIRSRIAQEPKAGKRATRLAWVTALALILLASLILKTGSRMPVQRAQADSEQELLVAVEDALDGYVPEALQPASLLTEEMEQALQPNSNLRDSKEKKNHAN